MSRAYHAYAIEKPGWAEASDTPFDVQKVREDFPILRRLVYGKPLVYLDNAATTQKPQPVIDAIEHYYSDQNANIHRGVHFLSQRATCSYEGARSKARGFLNAAEDKEIVFVRGTTEAINLVAQTHVRKHVRKGDEIIISGMEHHSNIVPWQMLCEESGAILRVIPMSDDGELLLHEYEKLLNKKTKFVSVVHLSNALGTINPIKEIVQKAHLQGVPVLVDGAQAAPHLKVDVRDLDCDFYTFSGHKVYGPTGIGVLYGKRELLEEMPPYQGGGEMILSVTFEKTIYKDIPERFEAGTPHIEGGIGLGTAIDYVNEVGLETVAAYEHELLAYATDELSQVRGLRIIGTAREKASVLSFVLDDIHPHDIGTILDREGVAVRAGHHCAQPVMLRFGVPATVRASLAFYNTREDVDALVQGLHKVIEVFG